MKRKLLFAIAALLCSVGMWADTSILSSEAGWEKITSFPATLSDYYFVFVDKNNDLMLFYNTGNHQGNSYKTMYYSTSQDPTQNRGMLWEISQNSDGWSIKSSIESTYYLQTEGDYAAWHCRTHDNGNDNPYWYKWIINYTEEDLWTIGNGVYPNNYVGPWDAASFSNGSEVAGNKTDAADIGHFYIYAIKKIDANVLSAIQYLERRTDKKAVITSLRTKYTNGTYTNSTTTNDVYNDYKALEVAALSSASAGNYTSALINPSFETGSITGWTTLNASNETYPFYLSDVGARSATDPTYQFSNSDGDYIMNYYGWSWSWNADINGIKQTIPNMPAGTYRIKTVMAGSNEWELTLKVNSVSESKDMTGAGTGVEFSKDITLAESGDLTIIVETNHIGHNDWEACFLKADNFRIYNLTHYYDELNAAIDAAKAKTLGFEVGEYAPYNNVTAINAIAEAEAVNQNEYMEWSALQTLVSKLTTWTVNNERMNAFYKGDFAEYTEDTTTPLDYTPTGWTASGNFRMMLTNSENYPGLSDASATHAIMSWSGGVTYGETTGYTMPLEENSIYCLTFKAAGWNNESRSGMMVSVLNSTDGMAAKDLGTPDRDIVGNANNTAGMTSFEVLFATGAAGNYVFHIQSGHNLVLTDLELKKATSQTLTLPSATQYAVGTYPNVSFTRSFTADNWNTLCLPFAFDKSQLTAVKELSSFTENSGSYSLTFNDASTTVAGKPYIVQGSGEITLTGTDVALDPNTTAGSASVTEGTTTVNFVGTFSQMNAPVGSYIISGTNFYLVDTENAVTVKPYRGYFTVQSNGAVKTLLLDVDGTDGIASVETTETENSAIYNLAGQRVQKAQKGLYIINGKKVVVK